MVHFLPQTLGLVLGAEWVKLPLAVPLPCIEVSVPLVQLTNHWETRMEFSIQDTDKSSNCFPAIPSCQQPVKVERKKKGVTRMAQIVDAAPGTVAEPVPEP